MPIKNKRRQTFMRLLSLLFISCTAFALISLAPAKGQAQTQHDMNRITAKESATADAALNKSYKKLMDKLDKPAQAKLRTAEKAWLLYRESDANFVADFARGGSIASSIYSSRRTEITKSRTKDLQRFYRES